MNVTPFQIGVPQAVLDDLQDRLARTRWPGEVRGAGWDSGANGEALRQLVTYWQEGYDWRRQEAALNRLPQFTARVDGLEVHFVHQRSADEAAPAVLMIHGWPDSFYRFSKVLPLLQDCHVVVPSLPGFGFSEPPGEPGFGAEEMAGLLVKLMGGLGYDRFVVQGGDWGSIIADHLVSRHAGHVRALHLTDVPQWRTMPGIFDPGELTPAERRYFRAAETWQEKEGAYKHLQSTKPQTLAYGLNDSPAGLAGWLLEKFHTWSDGRHPLGADDFLTNATIYWATQTIGSSVRLYREFQQARHPNPRHRAEQPTGFALFARDLLHPPRELAERFYTVTHWTELPRGGHFAALEQPDLFAADLRAFLKTL